jgi:hypothetical protein
MVGCGEDDDDGNGNGNGDCGTAVTMRATATNSCIGAAQAGNTFFDLYASNVDTGTTIGFKTTGLPTAEQVAAWFTFTNLGSGAATDTYTDLTWTVATATVSGVNNLRITLRGTYTGDITGSTAPNVRIRLVESKLDEIKGFMDYTGSFTLNAPTGGTLCDYRLIPAE